MTGVLLVRHAKSHANTRNPAFGNIDAPLDEKGIVQAAALNFVFKSMFAIDPTTYEPPVLASEYARPRETAQRAGFTYIETNPIINEADISEEVLRGDQIVKRHAQERWVPDALAQRARRFVHLVREGELQYQIYFTHGFFIAAVLNELSYQHEGRGEESPYMFDDERGYIPRLATITVAKI